jgi:hypothetical protein
MCVQTALICALNGAAQRLSEANAGFQAAGRWPGASQHRGATFRLRRDAPSRLGIASLAEEKRVSEVKTFRPDKLPMACLGIGLAITALLGKSRWIRKIGITHLDMR